MTTVRCDMTTSLDGFIVGLEARKLPYLDAPFFRITEWIVRHFDWREQEHQTDADEIDRAEHALVAEMFAEAGAYVMGRRMFDSGEEPWGEEPPYHAPVFVVTHRAREPLVRKGGTTFHFVTDGLAAAVAMAAAACPEGKKVHVSGGAEIVQQAIAEGLIDELNLHIAPVLIGQGTRLFDNLPDGIVELDKYRSLEAPGATHLSFRFPKEG
jgi:dihydrofolate reductase